MFYKPENREIFGSKNLIKVPKKWGLNSLLQKLAVGCFYNLDGWRSTARSTANGHKYDRWRNPVDRPKTESKALWPVDRSVDRALCLANVHKSVYVGRPTLDLGRPARSTARSWQAAIWVRKNMLKIFLKILINLLKFHKNSFNILHWYMIGGKPRTKSVCFEMKI